MRVYLGGGEPFELAPGDSVLAPVVWSLPLLRLTLTLRVRVVDDETVRLDPLRHVRSRKSWEVHRTAVRRAG